MAAAASGVAPWSCRQIPFTLPWAALGAMGACLSPPALARRCKSWRALLVMTAMGCRDPEGWRTLYTVSEARLCPDRHGILAECDRIEPGIQGTVLDVRYSKEYAYYEVEIPDGRRGWIRGGPEIELSR